MADTKTLQQRGIRKVFYPAFAAKFRAASAVSPNRLLSLNASGNAEHAAANAIQVVGASDEDAAAAADAIDVLRGFVNLVGGAPIEAGQILKADLGGLAVPVIDSDTTGDDIGTTPVGSAFTNQPSNDGIEVVSSDAGDTTQTVTIIGTTTGTDTLVEETVTLNGTTPVSTIKTNWGQSLAVKKSAATLGTVTVRKATGDATITAGLTAAVLQVGVTTIAAGFAFNGIPQAVASGATTKQFGIKGTDAAGASILDSQALTGATAAPMNLAFRTVTELYSGDVEGTVTVTLEVGAADSAEVGVGQALEDQAVVGDTFFAWIR